MGDMADFFIDRLYDEWDWGDGDWDEYTPRMKTCRYCGVEGLYWSNVMIQGKWRLVDSEGALHVCKPKVSLSVMDTTPRQFYVAGVQYRDNYQKFVDLPVKVGDTIKLVGEPGNEYDRYAIRVHHLTKDGVLLGYVPKGVNSDVWALHEFGYKPDAEVVTFAHDKAPWQMIEVRLTFKPFRP
jgi:hypothetical protein